MTPNASGPDRLRERLVERLAYDYDHRFIRECVEIFDDSYASLAASARILTFLPTLANRIAPLT